MSGLTDRFNHLKKAVKLEGKKAALAELERAAQKPDFWKNQLQAQEQMKKLSRLAEEIRGMEEFEAKLRQKQDPAELEKELAKLELNKYLSGPYDQGEAILSIHAGQGGTEAMDWAAMLKRMYLHYCQNKGYATEVINETLGEEAGIKSVTIAVEGQYAYGYLKTEKGTHRLVRQSPFNADHLRQTSFALVEVMPVIETDDTEEIKNEDLEIDFSRASGSGGQNVNKVSTAVRIKHKPSGIVVECQSQRYQEQNRKNAMKLLFAKLWQIKEDKRQEELKQIKGEHKLASWGNQIRSYVLHPYKQIKDLRTGVTLTNVERVLNGEIDEFIEAALCYDK